MEYAIIGGGICGLSTALALEQIGVDYQLFERAPELTVVGAGIWLAPNALQALDYFGVLEQLKQNGNPIHRVSLCTADLKVLLVIPQTEIEDTFGEATLAIHRARLQQVLYQALPPEKVHLGKAFAKYEVLGSEAVRVHFEDGTSIETKYLLGADGLRSRVRQQLFPKSIIRNAQQCCWRGMAEEDLEEEFEHWGLELWGDRIRFGFSKTGPKEVYWFAVATTDFEGDKGRKQKLLEGFSTFHPRVSRLIEATPEHKTLRNDISDLKPIRQWHQGHICLLGDAAHATTPNMGQGGAQAIEDAYHLAQTMGQFPTGPSFEAFQRNRQPKVNTIVKRSWTTGKMAHWKYGQDLRNQLLKAMPTKLMAKRMETMYRL
ncbi:FAD-dependent monooxygenase [Sediminicola luteus]|uniref:FAD-binding domain-containing protein n=1 Tax=Sediminicola luteus TaxID=319238 RepID=A0A2A4GEX9_9FLAO|nr:FAD-dependent monooxygenase [Sediminicola luteus]PCE66345.1 hypothetical protein B7P33_03335 [Sediminicola luteus]